jgi:hypothetical protein
MVEGINNCWPTTIYKTTLGPDECSLMVIGNVMPVIEKTFDLFFKEVYNKSLNDYIHKFKHWKHIGLKELHNHQGASFSAVFYPEVSDTMEGGEIIIKDPRGNANRGYDHDEFQVQFDDIKFKPKGGDVLIMPSFLYHQVIPTTDNRIAIPVDLYIMDI